MQASDIDWSKAPEGADKYNVHDNMFYRGEQSSLEVFYPASGWRTSDFDAVDEQFLCRPAKPATWNGTGLPPAGCEIEYHSPSRGWQPGEYIGQFNGQMVIGCRETGVIGYCPAEIVRPIRTPEQIAADDRERAVDAMMETFVVPGSIKSTLRSACLALYDAGYRKVEGDKQ